jgi:hypothetical protein
MPPLLLLPLLLPLRVLLRQVLLLLLLLLLCLWFLLPKAALNLHPRCCCCDTLSQECLQAV